MLDEDPDEALQGAQDHPVQHHRPVAAAVGPDVGEVEALRQGEIALDGGALPAPVDGVLELDVDLGPVKGAFARADVIRQVLRLHGLDQGVGGQFPFGVAADGFLRPGGEFHFVLEPEDGHDLKDEVQDPDDFALHLLRACR